MSGEFAADLVAIRGQAQDFIGESSNVAQLVDELRALDTPRTGEGGLDGLIGRLLDEVKAASGGVGMVLEVDGRGLIANANTYESADNDSAQRARKIGGRL
jgi:hypothetical protein